MTLPGPDSMVLISLVLQLNNPKKEKIELLIKQMREADDIYNQGGYRSKKYLSLKKSLQNDISKLRCLELLIELELQSARLQHFGGDSRAHFFHAPICKKIERALHAISDPAVLDDLLEQVDKESRSYALIQGRRRTLATITGDWMWLASNYGDKSLTAVIRKRVFGSLSLEVLEDLYLLAQGNRALVNDVLSAIKEQISNCNDLEFLAANYEHSQFPHQILERARILLTQTSNLWRVYRAWKAAHLNGRMSQLLEAAVRRQLQQFLPQISKPSEFKKIYLEITEHQFRPTITMYLRVHLEQLNSLGKLIRWYDVFRDSPQVDEVLKLIKLRLSAVAKQPHYQELVSVLSA